MIPNQWYPVLEAAKLGEKPVGLERLGERLVAWRDDEGRPSIMLDRCVHKGAALSLGRVRAKCLECPYHGLQFDRDGQCQLAPYMGEKWSPPGTWRVRSYPVREECGLIWAWYGDGEPASEVPWFPGLTTDTRRMWQASEIWPYHYTRLMDSNFDIYHFPFVHRSLNPGLGPRVIDYQLETDGTLARTRTVLDHLESTGKSKPTTFVLDVRMPCLMFLEFTKKLWLLAVMTPVDQQRTWVFARYYANYPLGRLVAWLVGKFEYKVVQDQDKRILDTLRAGPLEEGEYVFGKPDAGSIWWAKQRRRLIAAAQSASKSGETSDG